MEWFGAAMSATFVGHYPWFMTYNYLNNYLENPDDTGIKKLGKQAGIGFCSSVVSDTCSNSLRVVKTYKQTYQEEITYRSIVKDIIKKESNLWIIILGIRNQNFS